jgi:hypothetical protein
MNGLTALDLVEGPSLLRCQSHEIHSGLSLFSYDATVLHLVINRRMNLRMREQPSHRHLFNSRGHQHQ